MADTQGVETLRNMYNVCLCIIRNSLGIPEPHFNLETARTHARTHTHTSLSVAAPILLTHQSDIRLSSHTAFMQTVSSSQASI